MNNDYRALLSNGSNRSIWESALVGLQQWRDDPNNEQVNKRVQQLCLDYLLQQHDPHWFCDTVNGEQDDKDSESSKKSALNQIATFCVRLVGYKPVGKVEEWRRHVDGLLLDCSECVKGWMKAKSQVGDDYLRRRWPEETVQNWYISLHQKEQQRVKDALKNIEKPDVIGPVPLLYNILLDPALYTDSEILATLSKRISITPIKNDSPMWFKDVEPTPGLILLLVHSDQILRDWAFDLIQHCRTMTLQDWEDHNSLIPQAVFEILESVSRKDRLANSSQKSKSAPEANGNGFPITSSPFVFWQGLGRIIMLISPELIQAYLSGGGNKIDLVRLISGHLGDTGEHWLHVMDVFKVLLEKLDVDTWHNLMDRNAGLPVVNADEEKGADLGYAGARLHDALDNPRFVSVLESIADRTGNYVQQQAKILEMLFGWIYPFLRSLRSSRFFDPCFAAVATKLLDDLGQKTRFDKSVRAASIRAAMQIFTEIFTTERSSQMGDKWKDLDQAVKDVERHTRIIVEVAFERKYTTDETWTHATRSAQIFIETMAKKDAIELRDYVYYLIDERKRALEPGREISSVATSTPLCESLLTQSADRFSLTIDIEGISQYVQALSITSHLSRLSSRSWLSGMNDANAKRLRSGIKIANEYQEKLYTPVSKMLRYLANEDASTILRFLRIKGAAEAIVILVLSPVETVALAAQSVIRQAFDATSRADCFRALFQQLPEQSFKGLVTSLRTFKDSATRLPEACGQAKRLVRCLTDVISVLCDPTEVLIRNDKWMEKHNVQTLISKIWNLMCTNISLIFEKTELWAPAFENEEMTEWMRDALIFMNEMLDEIRTFEAAATGTSSSTSDPTPRKISNRGREMIESLNEPMAKLVSWLRLNDKDLLEQTSTIIIRMLDRFARSKVSLNAEVVKRIRRLADRYKDAKSRKDYLMKPEQIMDLLGALSRHPDHANEFSHVVITDETPKQAKNRQAALSGIVSAKDKLSVPKQSDSNRASPISIDSENEVSDDKNRLYKNKQLKPAAGTFNLLSQQQLKANLPTPTSSKSTLPIPSTKSGASTLPPSASSARTALKQTKSVPSKPSTKYRTAPTKMKNAIYSHSAMRAAQERSSSDETDSEAERPAGLARLAEQRPTSADPQVPLAKQQEHRKTKMLDLQQAKDPSRRIGRQFMTSAEMQTQNQNKARMRYNPDYSDLHRQILQWDVNHKGHTPHPDFRYPRTVPSDFQNVGHYIDTFLPLLLLECWNEIVSARDEIIEGTSEVEPVTGKMAGRVSTDDFIELFLSIDRLPDRNSLGEADIVLLKGPCQTLGKIHQINKKQQKVDIAVRIHLGRDDGTVSRCLGNGNQWTIFKLFPYVALKLEEDTTDTLSSLSRLSTAHREYAGLMSLSSYDLVEDILVPPHHSKPEIADVLLERAMKAYRCNKPQAGAIVSALSSNGFSLIQGPPGTGKTKTILGLVGAFISNRSKRATEIVVGQAADRQLPAEKLLLCAPSNAAVDEVAKRLKDGVYDSDGKRFIPKIVRIGAEFSINVSVQEVSLDHLVEKRLAGANGTTAAGEAHSKMAAARNDMSKFRLERDEKRAEKAGITNNTALLAQVSADISDLTRKIDNLAEILDRERDTLTQANRAQETVKRKVRADILNEADVICATLSGSGHDYLANYDFETVIIDEAAQSVEISSLIPLRNNCQRCIMVGDPNQLPPTVKSREATNAGYNKSLFIRLHQAAPEATHLLSIQYRMHPDISSFPSKAFYESRLSDGPSMADATKQAWHSKGDILPPYAFLHVKGGREEQGKHHSLINREEAGIAAALYSRLLSECDGIDLSFRVGIITPYKGQVGELRRQFRRRFGDEILTKIDFNTVDGFQGQEKDVIILSCVRGGKGEGGGIGFLSDVRRMNVALTRARSSLFVLGDSKALQSNEHWGKLVNDAMERGMLREVDQAYFANRVAPKTMPAVTRKTSVKGRLSSKQILPAPLGLMTPTHLAQKTVALGNGQEAGKTAGIGLKRRIMDNIKTEESVPEPAKKQKSENIADSNVADSFVATFIKPEELEEGEVPMEGVVYSDSEKQRKNSNGHSLQSSSLPAQSTSNSSNNPPSTATSQIQQPSQHSGPTLVRPKKSISSSMFIQRKRPGVAQPK